MYSLPIVRAIHFWHFFTEAVGIMLSCLVHSCLVQLGKNGSFVKEGIWRCFEVKNINCVWHFPLHVVAVCRWMAGQPKPLSCYPAGCLCVQLLLWLFHCFPQWEGSIHYLPSGSFVLKAEETELLQTAAVCLSVWLQFGLSSYGNQGLWDNAANHLVKR